MLAILKSERCSCRNLSTFTEILVHAGADELNLYFSYRTRFLIIKHTLLVAVAGSALVTAAAGFAAKPVYADW